MFYTYAEKQGNVFFDGWQMRQVAFDTMRRYLYYSAVTLKDRQMETPMDSDNRLPSMYSGLSTPATPASYSSPVSRTSPAIPTAAPHYREFNTTPPQPNLPSDIQWRKKMKVDYIVMVAKDHEFILEDAHLKETDLFQVEIHGESRVLQAGESPAPGPMLVHAAGWAGLPDRFTVENEEFIADPFFLRELYEALRDQFSTLKEERERLERNTGVTVDPRFAKTQTLQSPRGKNESVAKGSRVKVVFRLRTEYEFRRFWYVVQTVLGYDKLTIRPYRGLPPYDPRNGLIFAQIPMCVWHTFKALENAVIYCFLRGDLVGRTLKGELTVFLRGAYLCITHDMVMVLRSTGNIPRWVRMQDIREFHYSAKCHKPYFAFLSDPGTADIVFIPQPPIYGPDAIRRFSPQVETMRVRHVVRESCFASVEARRVIEVKDAPDSSVRGFIERVEASLGRRINFDPVTGANGPISCPLPKEQLAAVWRDVQSIYAARDLVAISRSAIPLYRNNTNDTELTADQLAVLSRRLERERESQYDIVGMSIDEARRMESRQPQRRRSTSQLSHTHIGGMNASEEIHIRSERRQDAYSAGRPNRETGGPMRRMNTVQNGELSRMTENRGSATRTTTTTATGNHSLSEGRGTAAQAAASHNGVDSNSSAAAAESLPEDRLQTPQLVSAVPASDHVLTINVGNPMGGFSFASSYHSDKDGFGSSVVSVVYGEPGARYISLEEAQTGVGGTTPSQLLPESHTIVFGQTPMAGGHTAPYTAERELNVDTLMSCSITHMRTSVPEPSDPAPPRGMRSSRGSDSSFPATASPATTAATEVVQETHAEATSPTAANHSSDSSYSRRPIAGRPGKRNWETSIET